MNPEYQQYQKHFQVARLLAIVMMVVAPFVFLILTFLIRPETAPNNRIEFVFYSLIVIAIVMPFTYRVIERVQVGSYRKTTSRKLTPAQLFLNLTIIKCALVEATFVFGLVVYVLSVDRTYLWYFYAIGAAWAAVYWPTEGKFEAFMKRVEYGNA